VPVLLEAKTDEVAVLMRNVLFLCAGNDYRNRFCEAYFNHLAGQRALAGRADSRRLAPDITVFRHPGPLSPHTHQALTALGGCVALVSDRRACTGNLKIRVKSCCKGKSNDSGSVRAHWS
jgi:hypothetical protein